MFATRIIAKNINSRRSSVVGLGAFVVAVAASVAVVADVVAVAVVVLLRLTARSTIVPDWRGLRGLNFL